MYLQSGFLKSVLDQNSVVMLTKRIVPAGCEVIVGHVRRLDTYKYCEKAPWPDLETVAKLVKFRPWSSSVEFAPTSMTHGMRLKSISTGIPGPAQPQYDGLQDCTKSTVPR